MKDYGDLDEIVRKAPTFMYRDKTWWVAEEVDWNRLSYQWTNYICPNHDLDERTDTEREADEQAELAREEASA